MDGVASGATAAPAGLSVPLAGVPTTAGQPDGMTTHTQTPSASPCNQRAKTLLRLLFAEKINGVVCQSTVCVFTRHSSTHACNFEKNKCGGFPLRPPPATAALLLLQNEAATTAVVEYYLMYVAPESSSCDGRCTSTAAAAVRITFGVGYSIRACAYSYILYLQKQ